MAGGFYVDEGRCIAGRSCIYAAPGNFVYYKDQGISRVARQPVNDEEKAQCIKAMTECPLGAIFDDAGLKWETPPPRYGHGDQWQLTAIFPENLCNGENWDNDSKLVVIVMHHDSACLPGFSQALESWRHRYTNLQTFTAKAPFRTFLAGMEAHIESDYLSFVSLADQSNLHKIWRSIETGSKGTVSKEMLSVGMLSAPMLMISRGVAICPLYMQSSKKYQDEIEEIKKVRGRDYRSVIKARKRITVSIDVRVAGMVVASTSFETRLASDGAGATKQRSTPFFTRIFASYDPHDLKVVESVSSVLQALGLAEMRWDHRVLTAGVSRTHAIEQEIDLADSFQLFWSGHAQNSEHVNKEWRYAHALNRKGFIKPVYWSEPMPPIPDELNEIAFAKIQPVDAGISVMVGVLNMPKYQITGGQQGAVGDNARADNFRQVWQEAGEDIDLAILRTELSRLLEAAKSVPGTDAEVVNSLSEAQSAAASGDGPRVLKHLAESGKWALDLAVKIGSPVATEVIKRLSGFV